MSNEIIPVIWVCLTKYKRTQVCIASMYGWLESHYVVHAMRSMTHWDAQIIGGHSLDKVVCYLPMNECQLSCFELFQQINVRVKQKTPLARWCESGDHLLASGRGIWRLWSDGWSLRLMPVSDLPSRTSWWGCFLILNGLHWHSPNIVVW